MKKFIYIFISLVATFIIVMLIISATKTSKITIKTKPNGANIKIGLRNYTSPTTIRVNQGNHLIIASKEGYIDQEKNVVVAKGKEVSVNIVLPSVDTIEPLKVLDTPKSIEKLPVENDKYLIEWVDESNSILITPNLSFNAQENPAEFIKNNWSTYETDGKDALTWLENNELGSKIREKNKINIEWWAQEYWPDGKSISL